MEKQLADGTKVCHECEEPIVTDDTAVAMSLAAVAEGLCIACYVRRDEAIRKAAARGFRMGR